MPRGRPANISACKVCGRIRRHYAHGFCATCYTKDRHAKGKMAVCTQCERERQRFAKGVCRPCYTNNTKRRGKYRIEPSEYVEMRRVQGRKCAICNEAPGKAFHVDHDHGTGLIRSLLCYKCNVGLGSFRDNPLLLRLAAAYVETNREHAARISERVA